MQTYKDIVIKINDSNCLVNSANIDFSISADPVSTIGDRFTKNYKSISSLVQTTMSLSYQLQANDQFKENLFSDTNFKCNFAGIEMQSGYLKSYRLSIEPNQPINVDAELIFWDQPIGNIIQTTTVNSGQFKFLQTSEIYFSDVSGDWPSVVTDHQINRLTYNYQSEIVPNILARNVDIDGYSITPDSVVYRNQNATTNLNCKWWNTDLINIHGNRVVGQINFGNTESTEVESLLIDGIINNRSVDIESKGIVNTTLEIAQNAFQLQPQIYASTATSVTPIPGEFVGISVNNYENIQKISLNDIPLDFVNLNGTVLFKLPNNAVSGLLKVESYGGETTTGLSIEPAAISINNVSTYIGFSGQNIILVGENFYDISDVYFGFVPSDSFEVVNSNLIFASVPYGASYNYIYAKSDFRGISGESPEKFVSYPIINNISPIKGDPSDVITINGRNFNGVTGVRFNDINTSFVLTDDYSIDATVPAGNIYGKISLFAESGLISYSTAIFKPNITITGFSPDPVKEGEFLTISGTNFISEYLYKYGESATYAVMFNKYRIGQFGISSSTELTGIVPEDMIAGTVHLFEPDGASLYEGALLSKSATTPKPKTMSNVIAYSGLPFYTSIAGEDLENTTGLWIKPVNVENDNLEQFTINTTNIYTNPDGDKIDFVNYTFVGDGIVGSYDIYVVVPDEIYGILSTRYRLKLLSTS